MYTLIVQDTYGKQFKTQTFGNLSLVDLQQKSKATAPLLSVQGSNFSYTIRTDGTGLSIFDNDRRIAAIMWRTATVIFIDRTLTEEQKNAINAIAYRFKAES